MTVAELPTPTITPPPRRGRSAPSGVDPYETDEDGLFEVVRGVRVEKSMSVYEQVLAALLFTPLDNHCRAEQLGRAVFETMFAIPGSGNDRKPDVAFVSYQRWARNRPIPRVNAWPIAPDVVVEVVSPTDKAFDVLDKVRDYFAAGVQQVWQVYSNVEQVWVFTSPTAVSVLTRADELSGDPVVPGFRMSLADLFPPSEPAA